MKTLYLPLETARKIALNGQLFNGNNSFPPGKEGVVQVFEKLGYVQIDTIAVVERAHHHTLWTRRPDYSMEMLDELQAGDRRVFEYWGHQASYLPMSDFRFYLPKMRTFQNPEHYWFKDQHEQAKHLLEPVLKRIREEGPLSSRDFKPPPGTKRGTWWNWNPVKIALELLYWRGDLMISRRQNFQKIYDLTERVIPPNVNTTFPTDEELGRFLVHRALSAFGVARERDICEHIDAADRDVILKALKEMVAAGEVIELQMENERQHKYFVLPEALESGHATISENNQLHLLSPFDNLIIHRDRTKRLFNFDYTIECYLPAAKRKYGYFTLPILWNGQLIGRLDPVADRPNRILQLKKLIFEPEFKITGNFLPALAQKIFAFANFNNCRKVKVEHVIPEELKLMVMDRLRDLDELST